MPSHVIFCREEFATLRALNISVLGRMHVLVMLVQVGLVVSSVITVLTLEAFWLVWKVGVIVYL